MINRETIEKYDEDENRKFWGSCETWFVDLLAIKCWLIIIVMQAVFKIRLATIFYVCMRKKFLNSETNFPSRPRTSLFSIIHPCVVSFHWPSEFIIVVFVSPQISRRYLFHKNLRHSLAAKGSSLHAHSCRVIITPRPSGIQGTPSNSQQSVPWGNKNTDRASCLYFISDWRKCEFWGVTTTRFHYSSSHYDRARRRQFYRATLFKIIFENYLSRHAPLFPSCLGHEHFPRSSSH